MRRALFAVAVILLWVFGASAPDAATDPFESTFQAAMRPYYAALVSSAQQDSDGTLRHLVQLQSRWREVMRISSTGAPTWAHDATSGQSVVAAVASKIETARQRTVARDIAGAHGELESIRLLLHDARARQGLKTFDDALTEYHDAMERITSHLGARNEFTLTADDLRAIEGEAKGARTAWGQVEAAAGSAQASTGWRNVDTRTLSTLRTLNDAATTHDSASAQKAAETLKGCYFDLLRVLSRG